MVKSESANDARSWWRLPLGDALLASPRLRGCQEDVEAYIGTLSDSSAALLCLQTVTGDLHCQQTLYFSPALANLAVRYGAVPCRAPSPESVHILIGCRADFC